MTRHTADPEHRVPSIVVSTETELALQSAAPLPQGFSEETIEVDDGGQIMKRSFLIHVPAHPRLPMPAVIAFHGGGQQAVKMAEHWASVVEFDFVIVCPQAQVDPDVNETRWEIPSPNDPVLPTSDLAFVDTLLQYLADTRLVDLNQVYATGFSNGAGMTWQLSLHDDFVHRFRGFAPVSQASNSAMLALAHPKAQTTPKPLCYMHGTADDNWTQVYNDVREPMPHEVVTDWLERNHSMPSESVVVYNCPNLQPPDPTIGVFAVEQNYPPDPTISDSAAVCFIVMVNAAHAYPLTGRQPDGLLCRDFNPATRILGFWVEHAGMLLPPLAHWKQC